MSARSTILAQFARVAEEQKKKLAPLHDGLLLLESGLDSLGFAIIVARLEDITGIFPFGAEEDTDFPVTLGDFIRVYDGYVRKTTVVANDAREEERRSLDGSTELR